MPLYNTLLSLLRSLAGPTQVNQSFFAGASNILVSGGQFINVAGDYVVRREHLDPAQVQHILLRLLETDLVRRSIAQIVGYSHENGGVTIIDALGEKLVFPPTIMDLFSDAHDNLSKHFRGKVGEDRVHSGRYCLVKQGDGMRVNEDDWNTVVQAGEVLVMCMLIKKVWVEGRKQTCPKCGDTRLGTQRDGGFYVCRRCRKRFTFERAPIEKRFRPPSEDDNTVATFVNVRKEFVEKERGREEEEWWRRFENWREREWDLWHTAERHEASRFEEVVEAEESDLEDEESHLEEEESNVKEQESDQEMC